MKMKHLFLFSAIFIAGCFGEMVEQKTVVAAPHPHEAATELHGKVQIKGFSLFLIKDDKTQIELNTDKILDTPVTVEGTSMKDGKFQVTNVKGAD